MLRSARKDGIAMSATEQEIRSRNTFWTAVIGGIVVVVVLVISTIWTGQSAQQSTQEAVHSVSNFYLQELAGRREQVVASNLENYIDKMRDALDLLDANNLSDMEHLQSFQARMKKLYTVEKFAFVDSNGLIYTSLGTIDDIDSYTFDHTTISGPEVSIKKLYSENKKVVIALPLDSIPFNGQKLVACFIEIDMNVLLKGLSLQSDANGTTFCNLYNRDGVSLTNVVLGGMSNNVNLLDALGEATFSGLVARADRERFHRGT